MSINAEDTRSYRDAPDLDEEYGGWLLWKATLLKLRLVKVGYGRRSIEVFTVPGHIQLHINGQGEGRWRRLASLRCLNFRLNSMRAIALFG